MTVYITFTGHRDKITKINYLEWIYKIYNLEKIHFDPNTEFIWLHGGAFNGFDKQVQDFINHYDIPYEKVRPDYKKYADKPKYAPIARNHVMIDRSMICVTNWDGRFTGGTYDTVKYAMEHNLTVIRLPAYNIDESST